MELQTLAEPGTEGMFFPECNESWHVTDRYDYVPGRPVYLGYDDGWAASGAACLGAWQISQDGTFYQFDEWYGNNKLAEDICDDWLAGKPWVKDVDEGWPDSNGQHSIEAFRERYNPDEDHGQGFEIVGWLSSMFSTFYRQATADEGRIGQVFLEAVPGQLSRLTPVGYKGKALPLWILSQAPPESTRT